MNHIQSRGKIFRKSRRWHPYTNTTETEQQDQWLTMNTGMAYVGNRKSWDMPWTMLTIHAWNSENPFHHIPQWTQDDGQQIVFPHHGYSQIHRAQQLDADVHHAAWNAAAVHRIHQSHGNAAVVVHEGFGEDGLQREAKTSLWLYKRVGDQLQNVGFPSPCSCPQEECSAKGSPASEGTQISLSKTEAPLVTSCVPEQNPDHNLEHQQKCDNKDTFIHGFFPKGDLSHWSGTHFARGILEGLWDTSVSREQRCN